MNIDKNLQTETVTRELIDYIVQKIVRELQPEKIILYGSFARGDDREDSDLDLFVIKESKESSRILTRRVDALFNGRLFPLDVRVRKPSEVEWNVRAKNSFYLHHILRDGKILYERT